MMIEFLPKIDETIHSKIKSSKLVKKFALSLAPKALSDLDYQNQTSLGGGIKQMAESSDADRVDIVLSVKRSKDRKLDLDLPKLYSWIQKMGGRDDALHSARVTAAENSESKYQVLDLLEHRITTDVRVLPGDDKRFARQDRWNALEVAYQDWKEYMK